MKSVLASGALVAVLVIRAPMPPCTFHHLHLNDARPADMLDFYSRLFDQARTQRVRFDDSDGVAAGGTLLLISPLSALERRATALWHFGWGEASLGESYLSHARREVAWEPPVPADRLHVHVRSTAPAAAAAWYGENLGVHVEVVDPRVSAASRPEDRMPEARVWLGNVPLLLYRTGQAMEASRESRIGHLGVACAAFDEAIDRMRGGVALLETRGESPRRRAWFEGPDRLQIELVEGESRPTSIDPK